MGLYPKTIATSPCKVLLVLELILFGSVAFVIQNGWLEISNSTGYEWSIEGSIQSERQDATDDARTNLDFGSSGSDETNRTGSYNQGSVYLLYKLEEDATITDVLSPVSLQEICKLEQVIVTHQNYTDFCQKLCPQETCGCAPQTLSLPYLFYDAAYNTTAYDECALLTEMQVSTKMSLIKTAVMDENPPTLMLPLIQYYSFFLPRDFKTNGGIMNATRSMLTFGGPLETDRVSVAMSSTAIENVYRNGIFDEMFHQIYDHLGLTEGLFMSPLRDGAVLPKSKEEIDVAFYSGSLRQLEFTTVVNSDMMAAGLSVLFVFVYMTIYLRSFFLSAMSIFQIICSIPASLVIYRGIFDVTYFSQMHILAIFLVLGVGADDVFVYMDKWKHCGDDMPMIERVTETLSHTITAVFNTSFTTAVAFSSAAISPVMMISSFGIFAAVAIVLNYLFVITLTPAYVVVWQLYFRKSKSRIQPGGAAEEKPKEVVVEKPTATAAAEKRKRMNKKQSFADVLAGHHGFFHGFMAPLLNDKLGGLKIYSVAIISGCVWLFVFMFSQAMLLDTPNEEDKFFSDTHMLTGVGNALSNDYMGGVETRYMTLNFVFGITGIERPNYSRWEPGVNRGNAVYDTAFDLSTSELQFTFIEICEDIREADCTEKACEQGPRTNKLVYSEESVLCPIEAFHMTLQAALPGNTTLAAPEGDAFHSELYAWSRTSAGSKYAKYLGFEPATLKLKVAMIGSRASVFARQPGKLLEPLYDHVTAVVATLRLKEPKFNSLYHDSGRDFVFMVTQKELVNGMFEGLAICFPVSFIVLLFATHNILIAFFATVSIGAIVACVLGCAHLMGWYLDTPLAIAAVIVIGFSVDYTVHLGHMYCESTNRHDRGMRVDEALTFMGPTVMAGAVTTFGSGAMMFICTLAFFYKMAVLICLTIAFSCLYSIGFLMAVCALVGPENGSFDIRAMCCKKQYEKSLQHPY